ncbi:MAG: hypothetical protein Q8O53_01090 [Candidatus Moranbacteria bacterium]|nr:hypothetical protein [Candidatus Moranbacteria bacterium]
MKCHFKLENGEFCQKTGAKGRAFCSEHKAVTTPFYFTADYAGYEKLDSKYFSSLSLAEWCVARGVAIKQDRELEKVVEKVLGGKLRLIRTRSPKKLEVFLTAVRLMIAQAEDPEVELLLFRFFNTGYEPHFKTVQDFVTHEWFTDEERDYLDGFIRKNFIERRTIRHQISALTRAKKRALRLAKKNVQ